MLFSSLHKEKKKKKGKGGKKGKRFIVNGSSLEWSYPLKSPRRSALLLLPALQESLESNAESPGQKPQGPCVSCAEFSAVQ